MADPKYLNPKTGGVWHEPGATLLLHHLLPKTTSEICTTYLNVKC